ncbi:MAG: hypothetical protein J3K34DRAFT_434263 [Monoraphidium minutum]|nr:MAG: hypothetical protein J3K34DRAFT_434263 [Monoraphidium minutum]
MASSSGRVLALYRRILRAARTWQGPHEERVYIEASAHEGFRSARGAAPQDAEAMISDAEQRLELGLHYGIAYPRLHHSPQQFKRRTYLAAPQMPPGPASRGKR